MTGDSLARRTMGTGSLWIFAVGASSPLTVLVGGIPQTYALTSVNGVPLSFVVIATVLGMLTVGYVGMAKHVVHPAPFYALLGRGLRPSFGVAGAAIALVGYNAIQISLYGLVGTTLAGLLGGGWQVWAAGIWLTVAGVGLLGGASSARVLGSFLAIELGVIICFIVAAFTHPAGRSVQLANLAPSHLLVTGVSGVLAFSMAAMVGVEIPPAFGEEARPRHDGRAMGAAVAFLGGFYLFAALSYSVWAGPAQVVAAARDPGRQPFALLGQVFGPSVILLATTLLVTSVFVSMSAFHGAVARYVFALARERLLPQRMARVSRVGHVARGGAPLGGSLVQSAVAAVVLGAFMLERADPMTVMFTWLSTIGALAVLVLLVLASLSSRAFFVRGGGRHESVWVRQVAPVLGSVLGTLLIAMMLANLSSLLGTRPGAPALWLVPGLIAGAGLAGLSWGVLLHHTRPATWRGIGYGTPDPLTVVDDRLSMLQV